MVGLRYAMRKSRRSTFLGMGEASALEWNDASVRLFAKNATGGTSTLSRMLAKLG